MNIAGFSKRSLLALILLAGIGVNPAFAQRAPSANSLARARSTFDATDLDKDGKVTQEELGKNALRIGKPVFDGQDSDQNGSWSREEFLVYYRQILVNGGQKAGDDLEAEVARIIALRRARATEAQRRATAEREASLAAEPKTVEGRLASAIDDLEKKAAQRGATREEFQRVRDVMLDYSKVAAAASPTGGANLAARFENALQVLEKRAKDGGYSREEFGALRAELVQKGREASKELPAGAVGVPAIGSVTAPGVDATPKPVPATDVDVEARLQRALDELEKKAAARGASREDFQAVRDAYTARAKAALLGADSTTLAEQSGLIDKVYKALDQLESNARENKWTREEFEAVRKSIFHRARAVASGGANADAGAPGSAISGADAQASIEGRFEHALTALEQKALARGASREDFQRVRELLIQRARASVKGQEGASEIDANDPRIATLAASLQAALDKLEKDAAAGTVSAEDFAQLRRMMIHRARAAANNEPGASAPTGPADARRRAADAPPVKAPETPPIQDPKHDGGGRAGTPPVAPPERAGPSSRIKPADVKPADVKPADAKPADAKPAEQRPVEPKPGEPKPGEPKPGEPKPVDPPAPSRGSTPPAPTPTPTPAPEPPKGTEPPKVSDVQRIFLGGSRNARGFAFRGVGPARVDARMPVDTPQ